MEWLYKAGSCSESLTNEDFECRDENGGPSSVFMAYLTITGSTSNIEYVSKAIFQGIDGFPVQSVVIKNNAEPNKMLEETIKVVINKDSSSGEILQEMSLSIACSEEDSLMLGDSLGALQLASFRNEVMTSAQAYVPVTWMYRAKNVGETTSVLKSMMMDTNGVLTTISPILSMLRGDEYHIFAHETISLVQAATFSGEMTVLEDLGITECSVSSNYTFSI